MHTQAGFPRSALLDVALVASSRARMPPTIRNARGVVVWISEADRKYIAIETVDNAVPESLPAGRLTVPDITSAGLLRVCGLPEGADLAAPVHDAGLRRFRKHCTMSSRFLPGSVADP